MKTKILSLAILSLWSVTTVFAQDRTTVTATNSDISDNLDLRAVASIFGDSKDLADFERRLNDPKAQISNLDLNGDNQVDYLRVIETVDGNSHLIVIQSVLGNDTYQDIATVDVEKDRNNQVQVQVVGDVYMYGDNYIYEPVYSYTPVIYTSFWVGGYRPYYSSWYWGYYPPYYSFWSPFPVYTYHSHIGIHINTHNHYNYVNVRRNSVVYNNYYNGRRQNAYERQYPTRSFTQRNTGFTNRHDLVKSRPQTAGIRNQNINNGASNNTGTRGTITNTPRPVRNNVKGTVNGNGTRPVNSQGNTRSYESPRSVTIQNGSNQNNESSPRNYGGIRNTESPRAATTQGNTRPYETPRSATPQINTRANESPRMQAPRVETPRNSAPREMPQPRQSSPRNEGNSGGGRR